MESLPFHDGNAITIMLKEMRTKIMMTTMMTTMGTTMTKMKMKMIDLEM